MRMIHVDDVVRERFVRTQPLTSTMNARSRRDVSEQKLTHTNTQLHKVIYWDTVHVRIFACQPSVSSKRDSQLKRGALA